MRLIAILFLLCGVGLAGGAIYYASEHFKNMEAMMAREQEPTTVRVLAARSKLNYGDRIDVERAREVLRWMEWPKADIPEGAFLSGAEIFGEDRDQIRTVLRTIEPGELVLKSKVTGFGEGLRLQVTQGMRAVPIPINAVTGGGGHVAPGDRVDLEWTRSTGRTILSTILLSNVKVIALDQSHDQQQSGPRLASTVTVEVTPTDAQRLRLAMKGGTLALLLRGFDEPVLDSKSPDEPDEEAEIIDMSDLPGTPEIVEPEPEPVVIEEKIEIYQPRLPGGRAVPGADG